MFFVLFALWLLFNGQWTGEIAVVGVVLCGLIYLLLWKFMDYSPKKDWQLLKRIPGFCRYILFLVGEIFKSAWAVMKLIWHPSLENEPQLKSFHSNLKTELGKVVLANSITLTPGTITVDVVGDRYLVHCLDTDFAEGLEDSEMEHRILKVEGDAERG